MKPVRWQAVLAGSMTAGVLMLAGCSGATADSTSESLDTGQSATQTWDPKAGTVTITVKPGPKLKPGWCVDGLFDWSYDKPGVSRSNHHDGRMVRTCQPGKEVSYAFPAESGDGLKGMLKAGVCYGSNNVKDSPERTCTSANSRAVNVMPVEVPNPCIAAWVVDTKGQGKLYDGGDPLSCEK